MISNLKSIFKDSMYLLFPHHCSGCGSDALGNEDCLCAECHTNLAVTQFEKYENNPVEKIFFGRLPIKAAHSEFYFTKGKLIQQLIHELKYKNNKDIGEYLGELLGQKLKNCERFSGIDCVIPIPLFADKEHKRGYNQATVIGKGIAKVLNIPVLDKLVIRTKQTETQTKKHRVERWENVEGNFEVKNVKMLQGKNILLVDDVLTTGSTIDACGHTILEIPNTTLYIATLAIASR